VRLSSVRSSFRLCWPAPGRPPRPSTHALGLGLILAPLVAGVVYAYVLRHRMETAGTLPPEAS
jgi:hypothetical protein